MILDINKEHTELEKASTSASNLTPLSPLSHAPDEPPPYSPATLLPLSTRLRPANYLTVTRTGEAPLKDTFLLDPALAIPEALLPPLRDGAKRRSNLSLETKAGLLDADVWIVPGAAAALRGREAANAECQPAYMEFVSNKGPVTVRLSTNLSTVSPMHLTASSSSSSVTIFVPRNFRGALTTKGKTTFSDSLHADVLMLEDRDGVQRAWIGEFDDPNVPQQEASSLHLCAPDGPILLAYIDEEPALLAQSLAAPENLAAPDPSVPVEDIDLSACPKGLVAWICRNIERRLGFADVKIEMNVLTGTNARVSSPL